MLATYHLNRDKIMSKGLSHCVYVYMLIIESGLIGEIDMNSYTYTLYHVIHNHIIYLHILYMLRKGSTKGCDNIFLEDFIHSAMNLCSLKFIC